MAKIYPRRGHRKDQQAGKIVWVNIKKLFDHTWDGQRISVDAKAGDYNVIGNRIDQAKDFFNGKNHLKGLTNAIYMEPSTVYVSNGEVNFQDGRHRLIAAYQLGATHAPVIVDSNEQANELTNLLLN